MCVDTCVTVMTAAPGMLHVSGTCCFVGLDLELLCRIAQAARAACTAQGGGVRPVTQEGWTVSFHMGLWWVSDLPEKLCGRNKAGRAWKQAH